MTTETSDTTPPLLVAIRENNLVDVEAALAADPSAASSAVNEKGRTALSLAAGAGHAKIVKTLDADAKDAAPGCGWSVAQYAAFGGHEEVLSVLVGKGSGAAVHPADCSMPPLCLAVTKGHLNCAKVILDAAPDAANATSNGRTALMLAAVGGSVECIELLVARGADINAASSFEGRTALMWAVTSHKPSSVGALIKLGADLDARAPIPASQPVVPGQDRDKGESAEDFANGRHNRDPTLRHISRYLSDWRELKAAQPDASPPGMPPLPWVAYAEAEKAKAEAEAAAKPPEETPAGQDAIAAGEATAAFDDNDIFGDADAAEPSGGKPAMSIVDVTGKEDVDAGSAPAATDGDLDALD